MTKIQPRILEKIEAGELEGLPAAVFVRGFVKSFARCVGLDESEAVARYGQCANAPATSANAVARAFVETLVAAPRSEPKATPVLIEPEIFPEASLSMSQMSDSLEVEIEVEVEVEVEVAVLAAPDVEEIPSIEVVELAAVEEIPGGGKKKRTRKRPAGTATPRSRKKKSTDALIEAVAPTVGAVATPLIEATPLIDAKAIVETKANSSGSFALIAVASAADEMFGRSVLEEAIVAADTAAPIDTDELELAEGSEPVVADPWKPTMPPLATSVPWKRPAYPITRSPKAHAFTLPTLVIDDSDPDLADLERDGRASAAKLGPHRVSFLPPILLDRDDKSSRQGGLTLAVILLLIAATLTLSYLMRRPSVSGDGMTLNRDLNSEPVIHRLGSTAEG